MNRGFRSIQDQGKTLSMVALMWDYVRRGEYEPHEVHSNIWLNPDWLPGYHYHEGDRIRGFLGSIVPQNIQHVIVLVDEINRVFPARGYKEHKLEQLLAFWQDQKLFNQFMYTAHVGSALDVIIRDATQQYIVPCYHREEDLCVLAVINELDMEVHEEYIQPASYFHDKYSRWGAVN